MTRPITGASSKYLSRDRGVGVVLFLLTGSPSGPTSPFSPVGPGGPLVPATPLGPGGPLSPWSP